jgi:glycerophosphoryl diester phosphodiesterase
MRWSSLPDRDLRFDVGAFAYAHRGLWDPTRPERQPENSIAAFEAAARAGVGCELDVRTTADGRIIVFHDATLERMCGRPERVDALDFRDVRLARLPDGSQIPTLEEALEAMSGLPTLVEIKIDPRPDGESRDRRAVAATLGALRFSNAPAAAMSFDEPALWSLLGARVTDPSFGRQIGQLIEPADELGVDEIRKKAERALTNGVSYLAPHISSLETVAAVASGLPLVTWTVRDPAQLGHARVTGAAPIFEGFPADLAKPRGTPI